VVVRRNHCVFFFSSRRRHTRLVSDWSSDVCSSDLKTGAAASLDASRCSTELRNASSEAAAPVLERMLCSKIQDKKLSPPRSHSSIRFIGPGLLSSPGTARWRDTYLTFDQGKVRFSLSRLTSKSVASFRFAGAFVRSYSSSVTTRMPQSKLRKNIFGKENWFCLTINLLS